MKVSFDEIGRISATFRHESGQVGQVCRMNNPGAVSLCGEGGAFCGIIESIRGGYAVVQLHGFAAVPFTGSEPEVGYVNFAAGENGTVAMDPNGRSYLCVDVDPVDRIAVIEL